MQTRKERRGERRSEASEKRQGERIAGNVSAQVYNKIEERRHDRNLRLLSPTKIAEDHYREAPEIGGDTLRALNKRLWAVHAEVSTRHKAHVKAIEATIRTARKMKDTERQERARAELVAATDRCAAVMKRLAEVQNSVSRTWLTNDLDANFENITIKEDDWLEPMRVYAQNTAPTTSTVQ